MGDPDTHQSDIPKKLLSEYLLDGLCTAVVESWQGNHEFYSSMLNRSQYLVDLAQGGSNHFLSEDMFACLSSGDHHIMMKVCRRIDDHTINIRSPQNIIEFLIKWNVQHFGFCATTFRRFIPYGYNFCSGICLCLFDIVLCMNMPETQHCNTNHYSSPPSFRVNSISLQYHIDGRGNTACVQYFCLCLERA